jgi:threonine dehydrogenase-like Zn-dependent dehydrogenase
MIQPDNIAKAVQNARNEGVSRTIDKIKGYRDAGIQTRYSISGVVLDIGKDVKNFVPGDRVAAAGAGMANHAEFVTVPKNLVVRIPENVGFQQAATVTMGAIAMQAVRRADIKLGEYTAVVGTGTVGMLVLQLLVQAGARVLTVDIDEKRLILAKDLGAELCIHSGNEDFVNAILHYTNGQGADAMLFCAATNDAKVLSNTFAATRKKGRVVMVGKYGKELNRNDIYAKELDFLISTSYGPGRYDANYEIKGQDYPYAYVRWTENRNMAEYLRLISVGRLRIDPLIQAE